MISFIVAHASAITESLQRRTFPGGARARYIGKNGERECGQDGLKAVYICEVILTHEGYGYAAIFENPAFIGHRSEGLVEQGFSLYVEGQG